MVRIGRTAASQVASPELTPELPVEDAVDYSVHGELLRSPHLTTRQREIAANIAAMVVLFEPEFTRSDFLRCFKTTAGIIDPILSMLTGQRNEHTPRFAKISPDNALIVALPSVERPPMYGATLALHWLAADEERSPELHQAIGSIERQLSDNS